LALRPKPSIQPSSVNSELASQPSLRARDSHLLNLVEADGRVDQAAQLGERLEVDGLS